MTTPTDDTTRREVPGHDWCVTCQKPVTPNEPVADDLGHTHDDLDGHLRWITQEPAHYGPEHVQRPQPGLEAWEQSHDGPSIGWDLGYWCRMVFSREADGTITAHVNQPKDPTARAVTPTQLTAFAHGLLEVAGDDGETEPIHRFFELTYANYLVLPRTLLQSMPVPWQRRFVAVVEELQAAFAHVEQAEAYDVKAGTERLVGDLSDYERKLVGYSVDYPNDDHPDTRYYDEDGNEADSHQRVIVPCADPVPHYNRGRTHIEPRLEVPSV